MVEHIKCTRFTVVLVGCVGEKLLPNTFKLGCFDVFGNSFVKHGCLCVFT